MSVWFYITSVVHACSGLSWRLIASILFVCFLVVVSVLLCWVMIRGVRQLRSLKQSELVCSALILYYCHSFELAAE